MKDIAPILLILCLAFLPQTRAVNPPPGGGYSGFTTAEGTNALKNLSTGVGNTATGWYSLFASNTASFNTAVGAGTLLLNTADKNTATGALALFSNTTGNNNNAFGFQALFSNTTGPFNNAFGNGALASNTTGDRNTAVGEGALLTNTTGAHNIAIGVSALRNNSTGNDNIAIGQDASSQSQGGQFNTAVGSNALVFNDADGNTAIGGFALVSNSTGDSNTATGQGALETNTTGSDNTAVGYLALQSNTTGFHNTAIGFQALAQLTGGGGDNIAVGDSAGLNLTNGGSDIYIGSPGVATEFETIRIGESATQNSTFIAGIRGVTTGNGDAVNVVIDSAGQLGTMSSSRRFKNEIKLMGKASETILALKPVTFRYKGDKTNTPQFGLIAEDVEKVNPDLIARDKEGKPYTVRYDQVNAMLLNEFLKEHKKVQEQEVTILQLKNDFQFKLAEQQKQIETL
ncbi:MAG TPA: tail fiber domain-containing protein, partial [Candidatus Udaeobacter sp.]|nr:tail fiber domain-containing protein [Candidatus Udaeobacter sp.]